MSISDVNSIQFSDDTSSMKRSLSGTGTITSTNLSGAGQTSVSVQIPHNYGDDNLIFQVGASLAGNGYTLPWNSNDSRVCIWAGIDATNLYIYLETNDSSGSGFPATTYNYYYRIIIP